MRYKRQKSKMNSNKNRTKIYVKNGIESEISTSSLQFPHYVRRRGIKKSNNKLPNHKSKDKCVQAHE